MSVKRRLLLLLIFLGLAIPLKAQNTLSVELDSMLSQKIKMLSSWSFDLAGICVDKIGNTNDTLFVSHIDATTECTDIIATEESVRLTKDSFWVVNHSNGTFAIGTRRTDTLPGLSLFVTAFNHIVGSLGYSAYWMSVPSSYRGQLYDGTDTMIDGRNYLCVAETSTRSLAYDRKTGNYDIPIVDTIFYYYDTELSWVTSISLRRSILSDIEYRFEIHNIQENATILNDSLFDPDRASKDSYKIYCLPGEVPHSLAGIDYSDSEKYLSDDVLHSLLYTVYGDTVRIKDISGWKLLNFWTYSCGACLEHFGKLQEEKYEQGYRTLDSNGITVICINHLSGNTKRFGEITDRFDMADISYAGRDFTGINVPYTPYYVLCAPDNRIVFKGQYKDYDSLIKHKRKYERLIRAKNYLKIHQR